MRRKEQAEMACTVLQSAVLKAKASSEVKPMFVTCIVHPDVPSSIASPSLRKGEREQSFALPRQVAKAEAKKLVREAVTGAAMSNKRPEQKDDALCH
jgi:hypothetical protein